jgi:hypothetical protein
MNKFLKKRNKINLFRGDGVAVLRFFNELFYDTTKSPLVTTNTKARSNFGDISKVVTRLGKSIIFVKEKILNC